MLVTNHGTTYSHFWNSVKKIIDQISQKRNEIVHWHTTANIGDSGFTHLALSPGNFLSYDANTPTITTADLNDFTSTCAFLSRLLNMFDVYVDPTIRSHLPPADAQTWRDIFEQALPCPIPSTHPVFRTGIMQGIPLPASLVSP
jgi:hypothetical protein